MKLRELLEEVELTFTEEEVEMLEMLENVDTQLDEELKKCQQKKEH